MFILKPTHLPLAPEEVAGELVVKLERQRRAEHVMRVAGGYFLFSQPAQKVVLDYSLPPGIEWNRMQVVEDSVSSTYFYPKAQQIAIVDRQRSDIEWILERRVIRNVRRWALLADMPYDLLYTDSSDWILSDELGNRLSAEFGCGLERTVMVDGGK